MSLALERITRWLTEQKGISADFIPPETLIFQDLGISWDEVAMWLEEEFRLDVGERYFYRISDLVEYIETNTELA